MTEATLPFQLNDERFTAKWREYTDYRRERRLPRLLPRSIQKQWDRLAEHGVEVACAAIDETIGQGWTGIFPERVRLGDGRAPGRSDLRASLGALQVQLKQVTGELEDLIYPGGCAHPRVLNQEQQLKADRLRQQQRALKERMACL